MKPKYLFQIRCKTARRFKDEMGRESFKIKNLYSDQVKDYLRVVGFKVEGKVEYENNTTWGMFFDDEHIIITDSGKYPYRLGDTIIRIGKMTTYYQAPINVR